MSPDWEPRDEHEWRLRAWLDQKFLDARHAARGTHTTLAEHWRDEKNRNDQQDDDIDDLRQLAKENKEANTWNQRLLIATLAGVIAVLGESIVKGHL